MGAAYWWVVAVAACFTLARFSEAFLILRAQSVGLPLMLVPAVLVLMNVVYALSAYPAGVLSDRIDRVTILTSGSLLLIAADLVLALRPRPRRHRAGRRALGPAHGAHAGAARDAGRRHRSG